MISVIWLSAIKIINKIPNTIGCIEISRAVNDEHFIRKVCILKILVGNHGNIPAMGVTRYEVITFPSKYDFIFI